MKRDARGMISFGVNPSPAEKKQDYCPPATWARVAKLSLKGLKHAGDRINGQYDYASLLRYSLCFYNPVGSIKSWAREVFED